MIRLRSGSRDVKLRARLGKPGNGTQRPPARSAAWSPLVTLLAGAFLGLLSMRGLGGLPRPGDQGPAGDGDLDHLAAEGRGAERAVPGVGPQAQTAAAQGSRLGTPAELAAAPPGIASRSPSTATAWPPSPACCTAAWTLLLRG